MTITLERIRELHKQARFAIPEPTAEEIREKLVTKRFAFIFKELQLKGYHLTEIFPWCETIKETVEDD